MSKEIFETLNIGPDSQQEQYADLDALFTQTRAQQPSLIDDNFTKIIVNSLPVRIKRDKSRSTIFDLIGLLLGLVAAYWFFDLGQFTQSALNWVPESLSLTVANVITALCLVLGFSWLGVWTAEKAIN
ncbi:hypothetical protein NBRC116583_09090 [Arenicella sp. 4NH20-0111]|uniref:hypothetical protein n=1 Tax=Arenicella sp. 4NH20-0111 TaxID=3127648 RepID=UPI003108E67E